ncbi:dual specificity protein phosphatase 3 [Folsomia candida]|uniref:Dual specificity protein phosphatase n=1 Tax=Folsomia candida TaxID=158441 RepID=A0A226E714_FOLCA|nr:dual specificity protein phosphatase 3 [Folsomia candida]XP_021955851.1 dual specificity protein phosphatase 3 [Folsomia candida]OXA52386.1 Dual specificity protein phosphatase 13 isoform A [Folsomia candida]
MELTRYDNLKTTLRQLLTGELHRMSWNDMDEVFPGIFLGGVDAAKNAEKLKKLGVTHVVNSSYTTKPTFSALGVGTSEEFYQRRGFECQFLGLPAVDISGFKISQYFDKATDFIHSAVENNGKVLVHCFMGVSRSATLVLAYLMLRQNMTAPQALTHVRSKRLIHPNEGFLDQICHLHKRLYEYDPRATITEINDEDNNEKENGQVMRLQ